MRLGGVPTKRPRATASLLSSHRGRAVTAKERDVVRGNSKWKGSVAGQGGVEEEWETKKKGLVEILYFNFCCSVYTLRFFGMSVVFQTCLGVCA